MTKLKTVLLSLAIFITACDPGSGSSPTPDASTDRRARDACSEYRKLYCQDAAACDPNAGCPSQADCASWAGTVTEQEYETCVGYLESTTCTAAGDLVLAREGYGCVLGPV